MNKKLNEIKEKLDKIKNRDGKFIKTEQLAKMKGFETEVRQLKSEIESLKKKETNSESINEENNKEIKKYQEQNNKLEENLKNNKELTDKGNEINGLNTKLIH